MKGKILRKKEIEAKLNEITDSVDLVSENLPDEFSVFEDLGLVKDGVYKRVEFAIENVIDVLNIINSDLRFGTPKDEEGIIDNIEKERIFDKKFIDLVRRIRGFRNILVHKYGQVSDKIAYESIKSGLDDFEFIIGEIEKFIVGFKDKK